MKTFRLSLLLAVACASNFSTALAAPNISATKDDNTGVGVRKQVGNQITYTITISNGAAAGAGNDATSVQLTDATPTNTTDVAAD